MIATYRVVTLVHVTGAFETAYSPCQRRVT